MKTWVKREPTEERLPEGRRFINLDFQELEAVLQQSGYELKKDVILDAIRYCPRFHGKYTVQIKDITTRSTAHAIFTTREGIRLGHFTDVAPFFHNDVPLWEDSRRYKWEVRINAAPGASVYGLSESLYQLWITLVEDRKEAK